jgi:hypothetical protein
MVLGTTMTGVPRRELGRVAEGVVATDGDRVISRGPDVFLDSARDRT